MTQNQAIMYSIIGGLVPAIIWLVFWLREDKRRPEPKKVILGTFILGMIAVIMVAKVQEFTLVYLTSATFITFLIWGFFEELFKFFAAMLGGLRSQADDEPIDPLIYMITAALGFAALENFLFILGPLIEQDIFKGIFTTHIRFVGASLLHVLASSVIGVTLSFTYYKPIARRIPFIVLSIVAASLLHAVFNTLITGGGSTDTLQALSLVWVGIILLLVAFERIKRIAR